MDQLDKDGFRLTVAASCMDRKPAALSRHDLKKDE